MRALALLVCIAACGNSSGAIPDSAACGARMTVNGPGMISFWWKVSCETNNDFLSFRFGNSEWVRISGEVGWQQVTMYAPGNYLTFEWRYSKNATLAGGQDRAWVDQVEFVPSANPACSYYIAPRTTSHGYGATTGARSGWRWASPCTPTTNPAIDGSDALTATAAPSTAYNRSMNVSCSAAAYSNELYTVSCTSA